MGKRADGGMWLEQIAANKGALTCATSWSTMAGGEQQRFCDQCHKSVINLSEMSAGEAEARLWNAYRDSGELPCVTFLVKNDRMVMKPDPRPTPGSGRPARLLAIGLAASVPLAGCGRGDSASAMVSPVSSASDEDTSTTTGVPAPPGDPAGNAAAPDAACGASGQTGSLPPRPGISQQPSTNEPQRLAGVTPPPQVRPDKVKGKKRRPL